MVRPDVEVERDLASAHQKSVPDAGLLDRGIVVIGPLDLKNAEGTKSLEGVLHIDVCGLCTLR
jgi:hypothetical protein